MFLRNYKGDFGLDLFYDEEKTGFRRVHKEGRCNYLTQQGYIEKEPAQYMRTLADTGLGSVPSGNFFVLRPGLPKSEPKYGARGRSARRLVL